MSVLQTFDPPAGYLLHREIRYTFSGTDPLNTDVWQPPSWASGNTITLSGSTMHGFGYLENIEYDWLPDQRIQVFTSQGGVNSFGVFLRSRYGLVGSHESIAFMKFLTSGNYSPYQDIFDAPSPYLFGSDVGYGWEGNDYPSLEIVGNKIQYAHWSDDVANYVADQEIKAPHSYYGTGIDGYGGLMRLCPFSGAQPVADDSWLDSDYAAGRPGFYFSEQATYGILEEILISDFEPDGSILTLSGNSSLIGHGTVRPAVSIGLR